MKHAHQHLMCCRNLANLVLNAAKGKTKSQQNGAATSATDLNLVGDREFLTKETAHEALAPLLAPDSAITKVTACDRMTSGSWMRVQTYVL